MLFFPLGEEEGDVCAEVEEEERALVLLLTAKKHSLGPHAYDD